MIGGILLLVYLTGFLVEATIMVQLLCVRQVRDYIRPRRTDYVLMPLGSGLVWWAVWPCLAWSWLRDRRRSRG